MTVDFWACHSKVQIIDLVLSEQIKQKVGSQLLSECGKKELIYLFFSSKLRRGNNLQLSALVEVQNNNSVLSQWTGSA
jgi:hypothetical protein